jgi:hypothetical protein
MSGPMHKYGNRESAAFLSVTSTYLSVKKGPKTTGANSNI